MKILVHVEFVYDRRESIVGLPNVPPGEVVVKRVRLESDLCMSLEELCQWEGQKILDADVGAASGCNHRVVITGVQIDGVMCRPTQQVLVALKEPQPA